MRQREEMTVGSISPFADSKTKFGVMLPKKIGITLSCQPQNWLLVANSEVGNSEYIHYSELPTPLIIVYLV